MRLPIMHVDAFTSRRFGGNPAAVVLLDDWLSDADLQAIAAENNLSETAFVLEQDQGYRLRWFTPCQEVDLCGHATLAAAHVLWTECAVVAQTLGFETGVGCLSVSRQGERLWLDFPARLPTPGVISETLIRALGARPREVWHARDLMCVFEHADQVAALSPDMAQLAVLDAFAVIVTAPGRDADFVSRFFAPKVGIPEDPVTGSAHCTLIPYWSTRLGKSALFARQISERGGELWCEQRGDRVGIGGQAVTFSRGEILWA